MQTKKEANGERRPKDLRICVVFIIYRIFTRHTSSGALVATRAAGDASAAFLLLALTICLLIPPSRCECVWPKSRIVFRNAMKKRRR